MSDPQHVDPAAREELTPAAQDLPPVPPALAAAMAAAHAELELVRFDSANPAFGSRYASLAAYLEVIRPALAKHQLWLEQEVRTHGRAVNVRTFVVHASGARLGSPGLTLEAKDVTPQALGSCITYAKRYDLGAWFGLAGEEDDDGQGATTTTAGRSSRAPARPRGSGRQAPLAPSAAPSAAQPTPPAADPAAPFTVEGLVERVAVPNVGERKPYRAAVVDQHGIEHVGSTFKGTLGQRLRQAWAEQCPTVVTLKARVVNGKTYTDIIDVQLQVPAGRSSRAPRPPAPAPQAAAGGDVPIDDIPF